MADPPREPPEDHGVGRLLHGADDPVSGSVRVPGAGTRFDGVLCTSASRLTPRRNGRPSNSSDAFPWDTAPRYLLRDRDRIFGDDFTKQVRDMGIQPVLSAPRAPWQRAYVERVIGSLRRECLDHMIVFNEASLRRTLLAYVDSYHGSRTHLSLEKDCPESRSVQPPQTGRVVAIPQVGGVHHRYARRAA